MLYHAPPIPTRTEKVWNLFFGKTSNPVPRLRIKKADSIQPTLSNESAVNQPEEQSRDMNRASEHSAVVPSSNEDENSAPNSKASANAPTENRVSCDLTPELQRVGTKQFIELNPRTGHNLPKPLSGSNLSKFRKSASSPYYQNISKCCTGKNFCVFLTVIACMACAAFSTYRVYYVQEDQPEVVSSSLPKIPGICDFPSGFEQDVNNRYDVYSDDEKITLMDFPRFMLYDPMELGIQTLEKETVLHQNGRLKIRLEYLENKKQITAHYCTSDTVSKEDCKEPVKNCRIVVSKKIE